EHDRLDLAEILAARVDDVVADQRIGIHDVRARAIRSAGVDANDLRASRLGAARSRSSGCACSHEASWRKRLLHLDSGDHRRRSCRSAMPKGIAFTAADGCALL